MGACGVFHGAEGRTLMTVQLTNPQNITYRCVYYD